VYYDRLALRRFLSASCLINDVIYSAVSRFGRAVFLGNDLFLRFYLLRLRLSLLLGKLPRVEFECLLVGLEILGFLTRPYDIESP